MKDPYEIPGEGYDDDDEFDDEGDEDSDASEGFSS